MVLFFSLQKKKEETQCGSQSGYACVYAYYTYKTNKLKPDEYK